MRGQAGVRRHSKLYGAGLVDREGQIQTLGVEGNFKGIQQDARSGI
jgi:hypothetical protein